MDVPIPEDVRFRLQALVAAGEFPDVPSAALEMIRRGLSREGGRPLPPPPVRPEPYPDKPHEWRPDDVNWAP